MRKPGCSLFAWLALLGILGALLLPRLALASGPDIRVVLSDEGELAQVGGDLDWFAGQKAIGRSTDVATVKLSSVGVKAEIAGKVSEAPRLTAKPGNGNLRFGGQHYRGRLEFFAGKDGGLVVLNVLPLEDYLLSVVPSEMPASWPADALKAQAIAARTYALSRMAARRDQTYDVYSTVADQAYKGVAGEDPRSNAAVRDTAGMVVTFDGEPIVAYYCADCGGCTLQGELPYLQSVPVEVPDSPHNYWKISLDSAELDEAIRGTGGSVGKVESLIVERDNGTGHLQSLTFKGSKGSHSIKAGKLRRLLGYNTMKSTRVSVEPLDSDVRKKILEGPAGSASIPGDALIQKVGFIPDSEAVATNASMTVVTGKNASDVIEVGEAPATGVLQGWAKSWVHDSIGPVEQKMRGLFAFDGEDLLRCNREMHIWDSAGGLVLLEGGDSTGGALIEDAAPAVIRTTPKTGAPPAGQPVKRQLTRVEYTRSGGLSGIVLHGSGYGHGMGMSQWGARQLASEGMGYKEILAYFYQGTQIEQWGSALPSAGAEAEEDLQEAEAFFEPFVEVGSGY